MMNYQMFQSNKFTGGLLLITGLIFLLGMSGVSILGFSPWHLMGLIPIYWIVANVYRLYKTEGRIRPYIFIPLLFVLFPIGFVAASILGFDLYKLWPLVLVIVGFWFLFSGRKTT
jgi:hypothetical protein